MAGSTWWGCPLMSVGMTREGESSQRNCRKFTAAARYQITPADLGSLLWYCIRDKIGCIVA